MAGPFDLTGATRRWSWTWASQVLWSISVCSAVAWAFFAYLDVAPRGSIWLEAAFWVNYFFLLSKRALDRGSFLRRAPGAWISAAVSFLLGLHVVLFLRLPCWWSAATHPYAISHTSGFLSSTWLGMPVWGVLYAWGLCAVAHLARDFAQDTACAWSAPAPGAPHPAAPGPTARAVGWLVMVWTLGFGTLAVLGYATGSPWLFPE